MGETDISKKTDMLKEKIGATEIFSDIPEWIETNLLEKLTSNDVGFIKYGEFGPSDFLLKVETQQSNARIGSKIESSITNLRDKINSNTVENLDFFVKHQVWVDCEAGVKTVGHRLTANGRGISFDFNAKEGGTYIISAQLYGQEVSGSPCLIPIYLSKEEQFPGRPNSSNDSQVDLLVKMKTKSLGEEKPVDVVEKPPVLNDQKMVESLGKSTSAKDGPCPKITAAGKRLLVNTVKSHVEFNKSMRKAKNQPISNLKLKAHEGTNVDVGKVTAELDLNSATQKVTAGRDIAKVHQDANLETSNSLLKKAVEVTSCGDAVQLAPQPQFSNGTTIEVGTQCVAKWSEDRVWYRAEVLENRNGQFKVLFLDYGNEDDLGADSILPCGNAIPSNEEVDENVPLTDLNVIPGSKPALSGTNVDVGKVTAELDLNSATQKVTAGGDFEVHQNAKLKTSNSLHKKVVEDTICGDAVQLAPQPQFSHGTTIEVGSECVAKWSEDKVWYRAEVLENTEGQFRVLFVDYGNEDVISPNCILPCASQIPAKEDMDENITKGLATSQKSILPQEEIKTNVTNEKKKEKETASAADSAQNNTSSAEVGNKSKPDVEAAASQSSFKVDHQVFELLLKLHSKYTKL